MLSSDTTAAFGTLLQRYRTAAGLSREALAERAGLSATAIGALERGERRAPYPDTVRRLVAALALTGADRTSLEHAVARHRRPAHPAPVSATTPAAGARLQTAPLTPLIGRERELAVVGGLLRGAEGEGRLVTLAGPAGVGKTRLALAVAEGLADAFPEAVAVVDLSPVREPERVLDAIAAQLGVADQGNPPLERLLRALADRRLLVVLDNFEQVLAAAGELPALLSGAPGVQLLATSRAPLGLRGEQVYLVPPLGLPDPQHLPPLAELAQVPAVRLFLERARALGARLELTEETAAPVAELCVRLDGLPLALELAAARTPLLSPGMILERLGQRLALLQWKAQDLPARQQTLAVALAWSYDLLQADEQALFRRLAVFARGFTLEAAEALAAKSGAAKIDVLDGLATLVSGSLVVSEPAEAGARRYRLLESMRAYALERLAEHDELAVVHRAHADYYLRLAERAAAALYGPDQRAWYLRLEHEQQNLQAALQWLVDHPGPAAQPSDLGDQDRSAGTVPNDGELLLRLATAAGAFWSLRSNVVERRRWLGTALQQAPDARPSLRLKALVELGEMLSLNGEAAEARPILREALALAQVLDDGRSVAQTLIHLGWCAARVGALDEALAQIEAGLAAAQAAEDGWLVALADMHRGVVARLQGQPTRALPWLEGAVRGFRTHGDSVMTAVALSHLGAAVGAGGDYPRAVACFRECLAISVQLEDPSLLNHAGDAIALGNIADEVLAEVLGALEALARTRGLGRTPEQARRERLVAELRARLRAERFTAAWERGRARSYAELVTLMRQLLDDLAAASAGQRPPAAGAADPLSPREHAVLQLVAEGLSNKEVAAQLYMSERTARYHLTSLFNKLGVTSRTEAVAVATRRGLV